MQLSFLDQFQLIEFEEKRTEFANGLIILLNEGLKGKDKFELKYYFQFKDIFVLVAINGKQNSIMFNAVDEKGEFPKEFCACWRNWQLLNHDLRLL
jgi:hypothetical protein